MWTTTIRAAAQITINLVPTVTATVTETVTTTDTTTVTETSTLTKIKAALIIRNVTTTTVTYPVCDSVNNSKYDC